MPDQPVTWPAGLTPAAPAPTRQCGNPTKWNNWSSARHYIDREQVWRRTDSRCPAQASTILRQIDIAFNAGTVVGLTDRQLVERFAARRDPIAEVAFAALVRRHGAMVLRVCRSILRDHHDAQDAFQATFLILARKAGSLRVADSLGPWLHGVACRVASTSKAAAARRRAHESKAARLAATFIDESARTICPRSSTKRSTGCPIDIVPRSSSATWRGAPTKRQRGNSDGRSERSRAVWHAAANACEFGWCAAGSFRRRLHSPSRHRDPQSPQPRLTRFLAAPPDSSPAMWRTM